MKPDLDEFDRWFIETADGIVSAGLDPALWKNIPGQLVKGFPGTAPAFQGYDVKSNNNIGALQQGWDPAGVDAYIAHYGRLNPWVPIIARQEVLRPLVQAQLLPSASLAGTEFYEDWFVHQGNIAQAVAVKLFDDAERFGILSIHFGDRDAARYNRILPRVLALLAPTLRAAMALNRELGAGTSIRRTLSQVLDGMSRAAFVVDSRGVLRFANKLAVQEFERNSVLRLSASNRVGLADPSADKTLAAALGRQARARDHHGPDIYLRSVDGDLNAVLSLVAIGSSSLAAPDLAWLFQPERLMLIVVRYAAPGPVSVDEAALARVFSLTPAEARFACRLASGTSLEAAADQLQISKLTARSHLRSIFAKTDTHRQSQLVLLITRLFS